MLSKINFNNGLIFLFYLTTFSGALRKWFGLPSALNNVLVGLILFTPTLLLILSIYQKSKYPSLKNIVNTYVFILFLMAINPLNLTLFHGVLGLLVHLLFFGLIWVYLNRSSLFKEKKLVYGIIISLMIQVILGSIQYNSPRDSFINRYAVEEGVNTGAALVGDAVRVTGTFSYIAGYGAFLMLALFAVFYLIKKNILPKYNLLLLGVVIYGSLLSGSRGTVGFIGLTSISFLLFEYSNFFSGRNILNFISAGFIFLFVNTLLNDPVKIYDRIEKSYENFMDRFDSNSKEGDNRLTWDLKEAFDGQYPYGLTGIGLGATYQGANALFGESALAQQIYYEGELFRLVIEGGYLLLFFRFILLFLFLKNLHFSRPFKIYLFFIIGIYCSIVFNIYTAIYLAIGLILLSHANVTHEDLEKVNSSDSVLKN